MSINKANRLLGIIRRSSCVLDNTSFALLYKEIVRPHLEYAATIWNPYKKVYIDDLEKVQRRATKFLKNISHLTYPERLAALNPSTLAYRRIRRDMIETFKILNIIYDSRATNFQLQHQKMVLLNLYCRHMESSSFKRCKCIKRHVF